MDGRTDSVFKRGHLTCHCLLLETAGGLVLVDTGLGLNDVRDPRSRISTFFLALVSPDFREEMTAYRQIQDLGFHPRDVRHILLSHLDFDHAGGIDDFPQATVHLLKRELDYAISQKTWLDRQRFRPRQWSTIDTWASHDEAADGEWFGFTGTFTPEGLPAETVIVPLFGHTHGHTGVAVKRDDGTWLLYASDAYFYYEEMAEKPTCTPGLRFYQWMMEKDRQQRLINQRLLRELAAARRGEVEVFCAHDLTEFERLSARPADTPPPSAAARAAHL